jgi:glycosyltransferase 2 family protein
VTAPGGTRDGEGRAEDTTADPRSIPSATNATPTTPTKAWSSRWLRGGISLGLLALLAWKIPLAPVLGALARFSFLGLGFGLVVTVCQLLVGVFRWHRLLQRTGERVRYRELLFDHLVASAYNMVLPSAMGGDVIRAYRGGQRLKLAHRAWSTTLLERVVGVMCLALLALPGISLVPGAEPLRVPSFLLVGLGVIVLIAAKAPLRFVSRVAVARAPRLAALSEGVADDLAGPLATAGARGEAFVWTLLYQALGLSILTAVVLPSGDFQLIFALYTGLPLIVVASMLPVSIAGLGLRESLFVLVLGRLGVDESTALALALVWLATYVLLAIAGVACALLTASPVPPTLSAASDSEPVRDSLGE